MQLRASQAVRRSGVSLAAAGFFTCTAWHFWHFEHGVARRGRVRQRRDEAIVGAHYGIYELVLLFLYVQAGEIVVPLGRDGGAGASGSAAQLRSSAPRAGGGYARPSANTRLCKTNKSL